MNTEEALAVAAYTKCRRGDPVDDTELAAGIAVLNNLAGLLSQLGAEYRLAANELSRTVEQFERYRSARERKDADAIS